MSAGPSLVDAISNLNNKAALEEVKARIARGDDPQQILADCRQGLEEVGRRFETREYFLPELIASAKLLEKITEILKPELLKTATEESSGKVIIATVKHDIHHVGKNLVASMLSASGFEVTDLGVDVAPAEICRKIEELQPQIVALSCLMTTTIDSMEETIREIARAGLRDRVKVIVGGSPLSAKVAAEVGADAFGADAREAILKCRELVSSRG